MDRETEQLARRIAAELVLKPRNQRGEAYDDEYLKETSRCFTWPRLRCAHCDCDKSGLEGDAL